MLIDLILGCLVIVAMAVVVGLWLVNRMGAEYDAWVAAVETKGLRAILVPVMHGSEIVGYTVIGESK